MILLRRVGAGGASMGLAHSRQPLRNVNAAFALDSGNRADPNFSAFDLSVCHCRRRMNTGRSACSHRWARNANQRDIRRPVAKALDAPRSAERPEPSVGVGGLGS